MEQLRIGMIGLDTSHAVAFTKLLNDTKEPYHVKGGTVEIAFPCSSSDLESSVSRVDVFSDNLERNYGVLMVDKIDQVAQESDAILLESVDGRQHLEQLRKIIHYKKPIFIDKPFCIGIKDAKEMIQLSKQYQTPIMSCSALRFAEGLKSVMEKSREREIIGADCFGPMEIMVKQPGYYWYGIHAVEMLFAILGRGAMKVSSIKTKSHDVLTGVWKDGRIGTVRGNRKGNNQFVAVIHFVDGSEFVSITSVHKPYYASLLEQIIAFFQDGIARVPVGETEEIIRFIEAGNKSRLSQFNVSV